ncbi:MAG: class I SAM-dependent methyltransferase [Methanolinea sp.]|jgi:release factor glutamine methyltransferase|nr:class I SAM-dependent methyltransferase [Methanolinea sp.]
MFVTHPQVYLPHEDTYLLLEAVLPEVKQGDRILEVGCGSGYIAARLAERGEVLATDINPHAVRETRTLGVEVVRADLLDGVRGPFDLVIFNPPYLPTLPEERIDDWLEFALDGGKDGTEVIRKFAEEVGRVLAPQGRLLLLISSLTGIDHIRDIIAWQGFESEIVMECMVEGEALYVIRCTMRRE